MSKERRPIRGSYGYVVNDIGEVFRLEGTRFGYSPFDKKIFPLPFKKLNYWKMTNGYLSVRVNNKTRLVHRLVAEAFLIDGKHFGKDINHKNGIKTDNRVENLEWCTRSQNNHHAYDTGLMKRGENHKNAVITEKQAKEILHKYRATGLGAILLNRLFFPRIPVSTISGIVYGTTWKHLSPKFDR